MLVLWAIACGDSPCAAGYGRAADGACVPLQIGSGETAEPDTAEPDSDPPPGDSGDTSDTGDTAPVDTGPDADGDGVSEAGGDCDDADPAIHPGALDHLGDGVDADCDGRDEPDDSVSGEGGAMFGTAAAVVDGFLVVGAPMRTGDGLQRAGAVGVYAWSGGIVERAWLVHDTSEDRVGTYVQALGDVDGDGEGDLAVSSPYVSVAHPQDGQVQVYLGVPTSDSAEPDVTLYGGASSDYAGWSTGGGDLDGDGRADLVVGATQGEWGTGIDPVGAGKAYAVIGLGSSGAIDLDDEILLEGEHPGDYFGYQVRVLESADGTGVLAVGAVLADPRDADNAGAVYLFEDPVDGATGADADAVLQGEDNGVEGQGDRIGWGLDAAGDFDGDGYQEVVVGCPQGSIPDSSTAGAGRIYVLPVDQSGEVGLESAPLIVEGEAWGDRLGMDVAGAFDANGDGASDLWIGAPERTTSGSLAGAVYLVLGPLEGTHLVSDVAQIVLEAEGDDDNLGWSVASGDLDGDGLHDLVAGARGDDQGGADAGRVHVLLGTGLW